MMLAPDIQNASVPFKFNLSFIFYATRHRQKLSCIDVMYVCASTILNTLIDQICRIGQNRVSIYEYAYTKTSLYLYSYDRM
jgi:hypothetical protein